MIFLHYDKYFYGTCGCANSAFPFCVSLNLSSPVLYTFERKFFNGVFVAHNVNFETER